MISQNELSVIRRSHLDGTCIVVSAHAPQENGKCHTFDFTRGVLPTETIDSAYNRVKADILSHIKSECGKSCECSDSPIIYYRKLGR